MFYVYTLNDRTRTSASAFIDPDKNDHANANIRMIMLEAAKQGVSVWPSSL